MLRIVLRRRVRPDANLPHYEYRQSVLVVRRLTIGRGADQHVHIEQPDVAPAHAVLFRRWGRWRVRALGKRGIQLNGRDCRRAVLRCGDVMTFGSARLSIEQVRTDGVIVCRLNDPQTLSVSAGDTKGEHSLKTTVIHSRRWAWSLVLGIVALGLLAPLSGALMTSIQPAMRSTVALPSDRWWQPGALHLAHRAIGSDCNACHEIPFLRVQNSACEACHESVRQHVPVGLHQGRLFAGMFCADCHLEHDQQAELIDRQSDTCTHCHQDLRQKVPGTRVTNVGDFSSGHPDFSLTVRMGGEAAGRDDDRPVLVPPAMRGSARQGSNLTFSHAVHLDPGGIKSPTGRRRLQCDGCHRLDAAGREMQPIRMQTHCAECHGLQFDEHDPRSTVPHGNVESVIRSLREHFSRQYLDEHFDPRVLSVNRRRPGESPLVLSRDEQRRALQWTDIQTQRAARELIEKRVCVQCHTVTHLDANGTDTWRIAPVRLTQRWYPHATFDHAAHKAQRCTSCHNGIPTARDSAAIHIPGIAICRDCHGDGSAAKVATTCLTCHDYHHPVVGSGIRASIHAKAESGG